MADDASDEIMAATYRALCANGYADLTMQDIADRTDKSKATLHYHYDSKRDLLLAFLDHLHDAVMDRVRDPPGETPAERLLAVVDRVITPPKSDTDTRTAFATAMLELKAQAPYDEGIRQRIAAFDRFIYATVRDLLQEGIDGGVFRDVDPDDTARFVVTAIEGAWTKRVALDQDPACTRRILHSYIETSLLAEQVDRPDETTPTDSLAE